MSRKKVEIFWTGGFDSSFRVTQLSRCDVDIQPYYLADNRDSQEYELNAIKKITEVLRNHKDTRAEILPLITVSVEERIAAPEITAAYDRIHKNQRLGTQYDWLGRFASVHPGIELGIHEQAIEFINKFGSLKTVDDPDIGQYWIVDKENTDKDGGADVFLDTHTYPPSVF